MTPHADPIAPAARTEAAPRSARPSRRRWLPRLAFWITVGGLAGFNGGWYWHAHRPIPDLATISTWIRHDRFAEAEPALRAYLRRFPHDGEAHMSLARILAARNDLVGCARELDRVPYWWPTKPESRFRAGQAYLMADRARDAEAALLAVVEYDPLHPTPPDIFHDAGNALLNHYAMEDRWDDVNRTLWRAYDESPPSEHLALLMLRMRGELERVAPSKSIEQLRRYVAADPTDWEALRALARAERLLGRWAEAMEHIRACLKARPEDPKVWRDYLSMLQERGELKDLLAAIEQIPKSADVEPEVWKYRGLASEKRGDWEKAARAYREAVRRNPFVVEYHYRLGMAEQRLGHRQEAQDHLNRSKALREARGQVASAYAEVFEAHEKGASDPKGFSKATKRIASLCETLGWSRAAEAWRRIAE